MRIVKMTMKTTIKMRMKMRKMINMMMTIILIIDIFSKRIQNKNNVLFNHELFTGLFELIFC